MSAILLPFWAAIDLTRFLIANGLRRIQHTERVIFVPTLGSLTAPARQFQDGYIAPNARGHARAFVNLCD